MRHNQCSRRLAAEPRCACQASPDGVAGNCHCSQLAAPGQRVVCREATRSRLRPGQKSRARIDPLEHPRTHWWTHVSARSHAVGTASSPTNDVKTAPARSGDSSVSGSDHLLTLKEAAEVLRLHPRTVREYIRRGEIQARLIGRRWRLRRKDLDSFFEKAPTEWHFVQPSGGSE
jgi:excisionase family DNA binding protein